ncbi:methyltransferase, FxLD system [Actinomadura atramentaria]|uniref:methyltransferase, FxLD system n=1 Tax=Actinomadura atramentaria TaxID=1990 RepID=UPI0003653878|nr:methyltransferase, FxLD system [Actinomadura atramentaria]
MSIDDAAERARTRLVDYLRDEGVVRSAAVEKALRRVPRHRFLDGTDAAEAYADRAVPTKRDADGTLVSSASQPTMVATMLEQLDVRPGDRVLEIGTGTGYNAALLKELAGDAGAVTTLDVAPDLVDRARANLAGLPFPVTAVAADGVDGYAPNAPYDRIIVTTGAWDLPPAWWEQLAPDARIVVPLRWRGLTRSVAFDHRDGRLTARSMLPCGFLPMRARDGERSLSLVGGRVTVVGDEDQAIGADALAGVFDRPRAETWSGVHVATAWEPVQALALRLAAAEPGACALHAQPWAVDGGLVAPVLPTFAPAVVDGPSLAYLAARPTSPGRAELGAIGHDSGDLTDRVVDQIHLWHETAPEPTLTAYRNGTARPDRGTAMLKRHTTLVMTLPSAH